MLKQFYLIINNFMHKYVLRHLTKISKHEKLGNLFLKKNLKVNCRWPVIVHVRSVRVVPAILVTHPPGGHEPYGRQHDPERQHTRPDHSQRSTLIHPTSKKWNNAQLYVTIKVDLLTRLETTRWIVWTFLCKCVIKFIKAPSYRVFFVNPLQWLTRNMRGSKSAIPLLGLFFTEISNEIEEKIPPGWE